MMADQHSVITGKDDMRKAYQDDRVAREYVARRFTAPIHALLHDRQVGAVQRLIAREGIRTAVEIAPGPARLSVEIAPRLERVTLIDASIQMLAEARRRLTDRGIRGAQTIQADAFRLPLVQAQDLVYTFRLIRHFERADRLSLYQSIRSVLKPGGWLVFDAVNEVVSAPLRQSAAPGEYAHYDALLRPDEVRAELSEAGFTDIRLEGVQHRFSALRQCQLLIAPRSARMARLMMEGLDRTGGEPLEWIVVCRRV